MSFSNIKLSRDELYGPRLSGGCDLALCRRLIKEYRRITTAPEMLGGFDIRGTIDLGLHQDECLNRFIVLGTRHLDYLIAEFLEHYNRERPHSAIKFRTPTGGPPPLRLADQPGTVRCRTRLGGVLRHYYRMAA